MSLQTNQVYLYSITTSDLFNEQEMGIQQQIFELKEQIKTNKKKGISNKEINKQVDELSVVLRNLLPLHKDDTRELKQERLTDSKVIAQFESTFTRALELQSISVDDDEEEIKPTIDFIVVEVYHDVVMEQIIKRGFNYLGKRYKFAFSSSGQIRTKKLVFVNEIRYMQIENKLTAGLTDKMIGSISINKLIAYKALCNSSSVKWEGFDINKAIVVPDFEFMIKDVEVDYINSKYEVITTTKDITNPVMDGCGIMLPSVSNKNIQFRGAGGFKGLLTPFPFDKFLKKFPKAKSVVKDVWGKEWNVIDEGIEIIFTASQMKFYKQLTNKDNPKITWQQYKHDFIKYGCEFAICNQDVDVFDDKAINYQMLQTLFNLDQNDLEEITSHTKEMIETATETLDNMLSFIGVNAESEYQRPIHKSLSLYNDLIHDEYVKEMVKKQKAELVKNARAGKILIPNTKRTYLIPDVYAFAQWLFGLEVTGLLEDKQVSCKLYNAGEDKLDVLRSPHLNANEHTVRDNVVTDKTKDWFTTNGCYVSIHDMIPFIIMCDFDGDEALIVENPTFVKNAKVHTEGLIPLQYELGVADPKEINNDNIYTSLKAAFSKNIGEISNNITKIFNQDEITDEDLELVKQLCYINNQYIDYAKTLWEAELPEDLQVKINKLKARKLPTFFIQAKDKKQKQVLARNNRTVNRLFDIFKVKQLSFKGGSFDYKLLMTNSKRKSNQLIIDTYEELTKYKGLEIKKELKGNDVKINQLYVVRATKKELLKLGKIDEVVDVLVKHLYTTKTPYKQLLWDMFGNKIYANLKYNLLNLKDCMDCKEEFEPTHHSQRRCKSCAENAEREAAKLRVSKQRNKKVS
ncbi:RNA dependent RNA polymerase [Ureibacillus xyleni]|uniref:RNA dependent RNA polymerase n=1 Tax=Ureibacillus xyleni TaxID=614648 RepID=A0A285SX26_9BACL|nr:hypothetical protein [Ureibacillus xyleni]SOC12900.1 RNA dependent RNA polymerase [Ureibacillus xyleni]